MMKVQYFVDTFSMTSIHQRVDITIESDEELKSRFFYALQ